MTAESAAPCIRDDPRLTGDWPLLTPPPPPLTNINTHYITHKTHVFYLPRELERVTAESPAPSLREDPRLIGDWPLVTPPPPHPL